MEDVGTIVGNVVSDEYGSYDLASSSDGVKVGE